MSTLLVADIGNSRIKLGRFERLAACESVGKQSSLPITRPVLPEPIASCQLSFADGSEQPALDALREFLASGSLTSPRVVLASVNAPAADRVTEALAKCAAERGERWPCELLSSGRLPIEIMVDEPNRVGIDRVCAAVAANRLRQPEKPAIVIDIGTAITVDLVTAVGAFQGGAILPGIGMSARALHEQTHLLPLIEMRELDDAPDAVGKNTRAALEAGLFWGAVGAIRELIARQRDRLVMPPQVFLTGGAAPSVASLLGGPDYSVRFVPHLVLSGIALAAEGEM